MPEQHLFADDGRIPNNPRLPLLVYRGALAPDRSESAATFEEVFARNNWRGAWRDGIYGFHHYHSTSHEVLGIARGSVQVRLGGDGGLATRLEAGDVVVIPAGVGHKNEGSTPDLLVVGAYPDGRDWDLCRGEPGERPRVLDNIAAVPLPAADPLAGADGPLVAIWRQAKASR
jgi:uncharacterized protein YjlB